LCGHDLLEREYGRAVAVTQLFFSRKERRTRQKPLKGRMVQAAEHGRFEEAAQARDAMRTVQALARSPAENGDHRARSPDVFGLKARTRRCGGPGVSVRSGRVVSGSSSETEHAIAGARDGEVCWPRPFSSSTRSAAASAEVHGGPPRAQEDRDALETGCRTGPGDACGSWCLSAREAEVDSICDRNAAPCYQNRFNQATAAQYDALETLQAVLKLPSLPASIECFDISTIQGSETVASMSSVTMARMRRSEYRKFRIRGPQRYGGGLTPPRVSPKLEERRRIRRRQ